MVFSSGDFVVTMGYALLLVVHGTIISQIHKMFIKYSACQIYAFYHNKLMIDSSAINVLQGFR